MTAKHGFRIAVCLIIGELTGAIWMNADGLALKFLIGAVGGCLFGFCFPQEKQS